MENNIQNPNEKKIEEKIPTGKALVLALQHTLVMNAYVVPLIIASILLFDDAQKVSIIQSTFLVSGITTLIQALVFMKYPLVYGASFVPVGGIIGIYMINGGNIDSWAYVVGACLIGAFVQVMIGLSKQFNKILQSLISPVVGASIVLNIGLSLIPLALNSQIFVENEASLGENITIALITMLAMMVFSILGEKNNKVGSISRIGSGIFALLCGFLVYLSYGYGNFEPVKNASFFARPALPFIDFSIKGRAGLATSSTTQTELTEERVNKGVTGLGIANMISSLFGVSPMTAYSSNVGVLALSKVFSRHIMTFVGAILILIGFSGKLSAIITVIPSAAIGGVFLVTSGIIALAGINMVKNIKLDSKGQYILIISMSFALGLNLIPEDFIKSLPVIIQYILGSSIASSALVAIILNKIIPDGKIS